MQIQDRSPKGQKDYKQPLCNNVSIIYALPSNLTKSRGFGRGGVNKNAKYDTRDEQRARHASVVAGHLEYVDTSDNPAVITGYVIEQCGMAHLRASGPSTGRESVRGRFQKMVGCIRQIFFLSHSDGRRMRLQTCLSRFCRNCLRACPYRC